MDSLSLIAGWTALHDYDLTVESDRMILGAWHLSNPLFEIQSQDGLAQITDARAGLPGGTLEVNGDLTVTEDASLMAIQARIEIDQLSSTLAAAGIPLDAEGVGQILIEPYTGGLSEGFAQGTLRFFDGEMNTLAEVRAAMGVEPERRFDMLDGSFIVGSDGLVFPQLRVHRDGEILEFDDLRLDAFRVLAGQARLQSGRGEEKTIVLSGTLQQPRLLDGMEAPRTQ